MSETITMLEWPINLGLKQFSLRPHGERVNMTASSFSILTQLLLEKTKKLKGNYQNLQT